MKAENALNDRQSREVFGFVKLKANMMKTNELIITRGQRPYEDDSDIDFNDTYQNPTCLDGPDCHHRHDFRAYRA